MGCQLTLLCCILDDNSGETPRERPPKMQQNVVIDEMRSLTRGILNSIVLHVVSRKRSLTRGGLSQGVSLYFDIYVHCWQYLIRLPYRIVLSANVATLDNFFPFLWGPVSGLYCFSQAVARSIQKERS